jgi:hypothetical protein
MAFFSERERSPEPRWEDTRSKPLHLSLFTHTHTDTHAQTHRQSLSHTHTQWCIAPCTTPMLNIPPALRYSLTHLCGCGVRPSVE